MFCKNHSIISVFVSLLFLVAAAAVSNATTYYVSGNDANDPNALRYVQADANSGATIILEPNIYKGFWTKVDNKWYWHPPIDPNGKNIIYKSEDPNDPNIVASTIIYGGLLEGQPESKPSQDTYMPCAWFLNSEGPSCQLEGLTIMCGFLDTDVNGLDDDFLCGLFLSDDTPCSALFCNGADPSIIKCIFKKGGVGQYSADVTAASLKDSSTVIADCNISLPRLWKNYFPNIEGDYALPAIEVNGVGSDVTLTDCNIFDNAPKDGDNCLFTIWLEEGNLTAENCIISGNECSRGIYASEDSNDVIVTGCTIDGEGVTKNGLYLDNPGKVEMTGSTIKNCQGGYGAGLLVKSNTVQVDDCTFTGNSVTNLGGAIYIAQSVVSADISNCTITSNEGYCGGGIYSLSTGNVTIKDCNIGGNSANVGGGIYNVSDGALIANCRITDNNALYDDICGQGGGIYVHDIGVADIINCLITGNYAEGGPSCNYDGGGLYIAGDSNIINCTIADNNAPMYGGAYLNKADMNNCIFWGNTPSQQICSASCNSSNISYCDIQYSHVSGGYVVYDGDPNQKMGVDCGDNNDIDPNFITEYHLDVNSPCIDAGDPNGSYDGQEDIDGQPRVMVKSVDIGADEAAYFPTDDPNYNEWVSVGKPACWCYQRQCHGDVDGLAQGKQNNFWVSYWDTEVYRAAVGKTEAQMTKDTPCDMNVYDVDPNCTPEVRDVLLICADVDHLGQGSKGDIRVSTNDTPVFRPWQYGGYYGTPNVPPNCFDPNCCD